MAQEIKIELKIEGLEANQKGIKLLNSSVEALSDTAKESKKNLSLMVSTLSSAKSIFNSITDVVFSLGGALAGLGIGLGFNKLITEAESLNDAFDVLETVAKGTGTRFNDLKSAALELSDDGLMPVQNTSAILRSLMNSGLGLPEAIKLFKSMREIAAYNKDENISLAQALEAVSDGVRRGNFLAFNSINLGTKTAELEREYANSLGKTTDQLTVKEKRQAIVNFLNQEATKYQGDYNRLLEEFSSVTAGAKNQLNLLLGEIGMVIIKSPLVIELIRSFGEWMGELRKSFIKTKDDVVQFSVNALEKFIKFGNSVEEVFRFLKSTLFAGFIVALVELSYFVTQSTKQMATGFYQFAVSVSASLKEATGSLAAFTTAVRASSVAMSVFKGVATAGLFIVLDVLIAKIIQLKDEVGGWGNVLTKFVNNALILLYELSIAVKGIYINALELASDGFGALFEGINKLRKAVGLKAKGQDFVQGLSESALDAVYNMRSLEEKIATLQKQNEKMLADAASNNGRVFGQEYAKKALDALKGTGHKAVEQIGKEINNAFPGASPIKFDLNKLKSDFQKVQEALRGVENGELGKIQAHWEQQNKIIQDAYKRRLVLEDGTVVNAQLANQLRLANDKEYFEKKQELEKKASQDMLKTVTQALTSANALAKFGIKILFDKDSAKQFAPLIKAISKDFPKIGKALNDTVGKLLEGVTFMGIEIGEMVMALFDIFTQAPEKFTEMFTKLIADLPILLGNALINVANLIGGPIGMAMVMGFINNLPYLMEALAYNMTVTMASPAFWTSIAIAAVAALIKAIPAAGQAFIDGIKNGFEEVLKGDMLRGIGEKIFEGFRNLMEKFNPVNLLSKMFHFDGGGKGTVENFIGMDFPFVKFATGGFVAGHAKTGGDSAVNDVIPALLSAGEIVLPRSVVKQGALGIIEFLKGLGVGIPGFRFGGSIGGAISGAVSGAVSSVSGAVSGVVSGVTGSIVNVIDQVQNLLGINVIPEWIMELYRSLQAIGASIDLVELVKSPMNAVTGAVRGVIGSYLRNPLTKVMRPPQLANGGEIPNGFSGDRFGPVMLNSGELVIDRGTTSDLKGFLRDNSNGERGRVLEALMLRILDLLERPIQVDSTLQIDNRAFGEIILSLNRTNARLS
jgi:hypothetical protein